MRRLLVLFLLAAACTSSPSDPIVEQEQVGTTTYAFGPYDIAPNEEITWDCVQISLDNADYVHINTVELTTGPGFHHSNWFYVPEHIFPGEDGTYRCDDRGFSEPAAALLGGVLFAQSTQAPHEIQAFPEGVVIKIPPRSKIVAQIHLLNSGDAPLRVEPNIKLTSIRTADVKTVLAGISFQNQALELPPNKESRFIVECDIDTRHREAFGRAPDFKIYYALAHYHDLGTELTVEAVRPDGTAATVYTTQSKAGDALGGPIDPLFDMTGFTKLRFWCDFYNPRANVVKWGVGDQEMCVFLAFSDSLHNWGGGVNERTSPQNPVEVGNAIHYTNSCVVFSGEAAR